MNDLKRLMLPEDHARFTAMLKELRFEVEAYRNSLSNLWRVTQKTHKKTDAIMKNMERMGECIKEIGGEDGK